MDSRLKKLDFPTLGMPTIPSLRLLPGRPKRITRAGASSPACKEANTGHKCVYYTSAHCLGRTTDLLLGWHLSGKASRGPTGNNNARPRLMHSTHNICGLDECIVGYYELGWGHWDIAQPEAWIRLRPVLLSVACADVYSLLGAVHFQGPTRAITLRQHDAA